MTREMESRALDKKLRDAYYSGASGKEIAAKFKLNLQMVYQRLHRMGLKYYKGKANE